MGTLKLLEADSSSVREWPRWEPGGLLQAQCSVSWERAEGLWSTYCVPGMVLRFLNILLHLFFITLSEINFVTLNFMDEKIQG